jgi:hypothetical protein
LGRAPIVFAYRRVETPSGGMDSELSLGFLNSENALWIDTAEICGSSSPPPALDGAKMVFNARANKLLVVGDSSFGDDRLE